MAGIGYYFRYNKVPGRFKNSQVEADTVGSMFLDCAYTTLQEYGVKLCEERFRITVPSARFGARILCYSRDSDLLCDGDEVVVAFTNNDELAVYFFKSPFLPENSNDEIVADIKAKAWEIGLVEKDSVVREDSAPDSLKSLKEEHSSGGCYIATAVYGSYDCPEVWTLRRFRDNFLAENWLGRMFIRQHRTEI